MKRLFSLILAVFLVLMMSYQAMARDVKTEDPNVFTNKNTFNKDVNFKSDVSVDGTITTVGGVIDTRYGTGNIFYVDSAVTGEYDGTTWAKAENTVDEAINDCTANNGDIIYVAQGHAESFSAADGFDADIAGITIIMLGTGTDSPEFTFADTDATIAIGAANVTIIGGRYIAGISDIVIGIAVEAGGDDFTLIGANFPTPSTNSFEFLDAIDLASGADNFTITNSVYRDGSASATNHFIEAGNGVNAGLTIAENDIQGRFAVSAIWSDTADTNALIQDNTIYNTVTGQHAIEFTSTATGMIVDNRLYGDTEAYILDPGSMYPLGNLVTTAIDASGVVYPAPNDIGTNFIGVDDNNNVAATTNVASNRDGSILERLEFVAKYLETGTAGALVAPADTYSLLDILGSDGATTTGAVAGSLLGAIGTNEASAATPFTSATVQTDRDGSVLERLEFINKYLETGTAGGLIAPADTRSLLDILGSDGTTTTGALAGSILGAIGTNEATGDTSFASATVGSDRDGSVLERLEFLNKYFETGTPGALVAPADTFSLLDILGSDGSTTTGAVAGSLLGAIGTNETTANTPFTSATVQSDRDGSALERLEFLIKYFETGTAGALVAPADTRSILDILGSDGTTTTGALAGSLLGAIGTNEATADTAFASATVAADDDGSVLERLEFVQTMNGQVFVFPVTSSADTTHFVSTNAIGFGDGYFVTGFMALVIYDAGAANGAPEGEMVDISGYTSATGTFTIGATTQLAAGDIVMVARDEFFATGMNAADAASDFSSAAVTPNHDGTVLERLEAIATSNMPNYKHPNYLAVSTGTFDTTGTWSTAAAHEIAVVTGAVMMTVLPEIKTTVASVSDTGTLALGDETTTNSLIAATTMGSGLGATGEWWVDDSLADTVVLGSQVEALTFVVGNGKDIGYTVATNAMSGGSITFHIWWTPLDSTGAVTAGAGGAF